MKMRRAIHMLLAIGAMSALSILAKAQAPADSKGSSSTHVLLVGSAVPQTDLTYVRPTEKTMLRNYAFDAFGPYSIASAGIAAGINQAENTPPEWGQGAKGYGKRFASDFGIAAVTTTTRYALAEVFHEDTLYYRCECKGLFPRLKHSVISTVTARRGNDGHRVFSVPALVAPYSGTMTAVYGWYPDRYGYKDGFRMGNYAVLVYMGGNIAREFLYGGPHSLLFRTHRKNGHGTPDPSPQP